MNACGSCTRCCKVMRVTQPPAFEKPAGQKCPHQCKSGCSIYDTRPTPCREWSCLWLASQGRGDAEMAPALRPDRSHCVVEATGHSLVVHAEYPAAWRKEPMLSYLLDIAGRLPVIVEETRDGTPVRLKPDGSTVPLQLLGTRPDGRRDYVQFGEGVPA